MPIYGEICLWEPTSFSFAYEYLRRLFMRDRLFCCPLEATFLRFGYTFYGTYKAPRRARARLLPLLLPSPSLLFPPLLFPPPLLSPSLPPLSLLACPIDVREHYANAQSHLPRLQRRGLKQAQLEQPIYLPS